MTHSTPTRYGPVKPPGISHEPGGHVVSCKCRWLRFYEHDEDARKALAEHVKKCKAHKAVAVR
jgi:hypothetical protein